MIMNTKIFKLISKNFSQGKSHLISNNSSLTTSLNSKSFSRFINTPKFNFATHTMQLPKLGDSISDAVIQTYFKKPGDFVKEDEVLAAVETDKLTVEIRSSHSGVIQKFYVKDGEKLDVGASFVDIDTSATAGASAEKPAEKVAEKSVEKSAPVQEKPKEVKQEAPQAKKETPVKESKPVQQPTPAFSGTRTERREPMNRMRLRIAERLKGSQNTYATLSTFNEVDMSEVMNYRNNFQDEFSKKYGIKLGFMSFFLKASVIALQEMPVVNSVIDGSDIIHRDYIDISVAVASAKGLLVPVIRNAENLSLAQFEITLRDLANKARDNKINVEDMVGGNFTISNGGIYGSMLGTPIINPPQSAILGMHAIVNRAVVRGNDIVARPIMNLALSYDHKLLDGREGVLFLKKIRDLVEDPRRIIVGL